MDLKQVRLNIRVRCVENEIRIRLAGHFGHVLVSVYNLRYEHDLVLEHLDDVLMLGVHVVLVVRFGQLAVDRPHLPGDALRLEGPARAPLLEELEADRASRRRRAAVHASQQLREVRDLPLDAPAERLRLAAHVREVDEVAVDVNVADRPDGVALLVVVGELATRPVEEHRVEYAGHHLVNLPPLHRQLERYAARVHLAGVTGSARGSLTLLPT